MRILITGACGTLGRAIRQIGGSEHEFVSFDSSQEVVGEGGICGSIADRAAVHRAVEGCQAILHTAAMHGALYGRATNAEFIQTNVVGAEHLFEAAIKFKIRRLAMASSMEVIFGRNWGGHGTAISDESFEPRPDWIYPVTKRQVEILGAYYAREHGLEVVQLRYMAFKKATITELGPSLLARYLSAEDAARATLEAAIRPGVQNEIVHVGPYSPFTQADVNDAQTDPTKVLERYWPGCGDILANNKVVVRCTHFWPVTRISHAASVLGWRPRDTFESFLRALGWVPR